MSDSEEEHGFSLDSVFTEPPRPPSPEPTIVTYTRDARADSSTPGDLIYGGDIEPPWSTIEIRLVGSHPLWGHHLWNASRAFASYLNERLDIYRGRAVLELGAGGGLPGIVSAKNGARTVVLTDYPDAALLENLTFNVEKNIPPEDMPRVYVKGYIWGHPVDPLLDALPTSSSGPPRGFDLIILSDLIFNHSQHDALLQTCEQSLSPSPTQHSSHAEPCLLVFYTHHRPHLAQRDMAFFDKARARGWACEEVLTRKFPPMFPDDLGAEEVRATVHGWRLTRSKAASVT